MAIARPAAVERRAPVRGKRGFAKRALGFAKRASALPGFPILWAISAAVAVLMIVTGGFNTNLMPAPQRAVFWIALFAWNAFKWQLWFALTVRRPRDWTWAALLGAVVLNLPMPVEIALALRIAGIHAATDALGIWINTLLISGAIFPVMLLIKRRLSGAAQAASAEPFVAVPGGLLERARVAPGALRAIEAEDHYCRVRRADGSDALIHYRFGDALDEVAGIDGLQVHRGAWVADGAVTGAAREGRRWLLVLADGRRVAVSATHLPAVRARGWLALRQA